MSTTTKWILIGPDGGPGALGLSAAITRDEPLGNISVRCHFIECTEKQFDLRAMCAPQRWSANFVSRPLLRLIRSILPGDFVCVLTVVLGHGHDDAIARSDIVQQKIAVWMDCLAAKCVGHRECATVDLGPGRRGGQ